MDYKIKETEVFSSLEENDPWSCLKLRIAHIGIAVKDAEVALKLYREVLGLDPTHTEIVESQKVKTVHIPIGDSSIELLESTSPDGVVAKFIEKHKRFCVHLSIQNGFGNNE